MMTQTLPAPLALYGTALRAQQRLQARLHAQLSEVVADYDDALLALAETESERELGLPCVTVGAVQARVARCQAAIAALQAECAQLDRLAGDL